MRAKDQRKRDRCQSILPTSGHHVLPYKHTQAVAVVVPSQRLYLYVFSKRIEAQAFGKLYIVDKILITLWGIVSILIIALIK